MYWRVNIWIKSFVICTAMISAAGCGGAAELSRADQSPASTAIPGLVAAVPSSSIANTRAPQAPQSTAIPGTDPAIQRWFLNNGAAKVASNDALLRAERGTAAGKAAECQPLVASSRVLLNVLPKLKGLSVAGQKLAAAMQTPVATFGLAGSQCVAGDFSAAKATLDLGVSQQREAQSSIDEILDGDK